MARQRRTFAAWAKRLGLLLGLGLFAFACNRSDPPTPTPPPTVAVVAGAAVARPTELPSQAPTPAIEATTPAPAVDGPITSDVANQESIFTSPRYSYTVILPCCWVAFPTPATAMESALAENELPGWGDLAESMRERETGALLELIALLPDAQNGAAPMAQMTVSVLPSHGLTLDGYLSATAAELNSIANTTVLSAQMNSTLGVGNLPASVIEYTAEPTPAATTDQTIAGLQVAFFGEDAETLIVLTFTTTTDHFDALRPDFLQIVQMVTLDDSAA